MNKILLFSLFACLTTPVGAQQLLTLDSCRAMALRNNKQLRVSRVKQDVAANLRKSARTKYLPHVSALGGYEWTSKEISLLNDDQKSSLSNMGTNLTSGIQEKAGEAMQNVPQSVWQILGGLGITPASIQEGIGNILNPMGNALNQTGQRIVDGDATCLHGWCYHCHEQDGRYW